METNSNGFQNEPQVATEILNQNPIPVLPQNVQETQNMKATPFYKDSLFWILIFLVLSLGGVIWFLVVPLFYKPLVADVQVDGDDIKLHVTRLVAPANGFLVIQEDLDGLPGVVFLLSPFILKDTYEDFNVPFINDEIRTSDYYKKMLQNDKFYVSYHVDDGDGVYTQNLDSEIATYHFSHKIQLVIDKGLAK